MTIIFRDVNDSSTLNIPPEYSEMDIIMINHDRKIVVNPLEDLDMDEKLAVLTDIINSDPIQNELNIVE